MDLWGALQPIGEVVWLRINSPFQGSSSGKVDPYLPCAGRDGSTSPPGMQGCVAGGEEAIIQLNWLLLKLIIKALGLLEELVTAFLFKCFGVFFDK